MVSGDPRSAPVISMNRTLEPTKRAVLVPAWRWRTVIESPGGGVPDLLLGAIIDLRRAGETSASRQADLLQLPRDLVEYLNNRVRAAYGEIAEPQTKPAHTRVSWIVRDLRTDQLWPVELQPGPPLRVVYSGSHWPRRLELGTLGSPIRQHVLAAFRGSFDAPATPTPDEVAATLNRNQSTVLRVSVLQPGEACLVSCPLIADRGGLFVVADPTDGEVHPQLTTLVRQAAENDPDLLKFLDAREEAGEGGPDRMRSPLARSIVRLQGMVQQARHGMLGPRRGPMIGQVELVLGRYLDELSRTAPDRDTAGHRGEVMASAAVPLGLAPLTPGLIRSIDTAPRLSVLARTCDLLIYLAQTPRSPLRSSVEPPDLMHAAVEFHDLETIHGEDMRVVRLGDHVVKLCTELQLSEAPGDQ